MYSVRALNGLIRIYFKTKRCLVRCSNGVPHEVADTIRSRDVQVVFVHRFVSGHDLQVLVQPHHALKQIIGWCNFVLDRCLCGHALHNFAEIAVCARRLPLLRHSLFCCIQLHVVSVTRSREMPTERRHDRAGTARASPPTCRAL
jgi:hypothetical protein